MHEEGRTEPTARVTVRYCGGCNPHIDRVAVVAALHLDDLDGHNGATLRVSGCPRACASDHRLVATREGARAAGSGETSNASDDPVTVVVAGELVDGIPTPAAQLAPTITRKLKE